MAVFQSVSELFQNLFGGPQGLLTLGAILITVGLAVKAVRSGPKKLTIDHVIWLGLILIAIYFVGAFVYGVFCQAAGEEFQPSQQQVPSPQVIAIPVPMTSETCPIRLQSRSAMAFSITGEETMPLWLDAGKCKWTVRDGPDHFAIYQPGKNQPMEVSNSGSGISRNLGHLGNKIGLKFPGPCTLIVETL